MSAHPASPHYADQSGAGRAVHLLPMRYGRERIQADAEAHQVLEPGA